MKSFKLPPPLSCSLPPLLLPTPSSAPPTTHTHILSGFKTTKIVRMKENKEKLYFESDFLLIYSQ